MHHAKEHAEFITATCLEWKHVLSDDRVKDLITESLTYLTRTNRIHVFAFVIMSNHLHMIWQMLDDNRREDVQRDFLKYTAQQIVRHLRVEDPTLLEELQVNAGDRKHQVWERNALSIPIWSDNVLWQKLAYIHENPVRAGLCQRSWDYLYSSAGFYFRRSERWQFLSHVGG